MDIDVGVLGHYCSFREMNTSFHTPLQRRLLISLPSADLEVCFCMCVCFLVSGLRLCQIFTLEMSDVSEKQKYV